MWGELFRGIKSFFENIMFAPLDMLAKLELSDWWTANTINWLFIIICCVAMIYWLQQLIKFSKGDVGNDTPSESTSHSFLK